MKFTNNNLVRLICTLITLLLLPIGCADSGLGGLTVKKHVPLPEVGNKDIPPSPAVKNRNAAVRPERMRPMLINQKTALQKIDSVFVKRRMRTYQDELEKWQGTVSGGNGPPEGWDECLMSLKQIAGRYRKLQNKIIRGQTTTDPDVYTKLLQEDVLFQASPCNNLVRQGTGGMVAAAGQQLETDLRAAGQQGNYQEVISLYEQLDSVAEGRISPEIMMLYADARLKSNNPAAAAEVFSKLKIKYSDYSPWLMGQQTARLFLAAGNIDSARNEYENLLDYYGTLQSDETVIREQLAFLQNAGRHRQELSWFSAVLRGSLNFNGQHLSREMMGAMAGLESNFPGTVYTEKAREIYVPCEKQMRAWADKQLAMVENLIADKQFVQAGEILKTVSSGPLPVELEGRINQFDKQINLGENEEKETQQQLIEHARKTQWQEGVKLLDSRRYDEAIAVFTALLDSDYREKAEEHIAEAQKSAAIDLRRRSAGLFIKARKTADPQLKGELLVEARQMLLEIIEKYPQVDIIDKVRQNLKVIEEDIFQLDPGLLDNEEL
jgi:tetratricopeptide (TPR) repeat protein